MGLKAVANPAAGGQPGSFTTLTVTGQGLFANGTAAAPSISFTNDPDCGLYRIAANLVGMSINGSRRFDFGDTYNASIGDFYIENSGFLNMAERTAPAAPTANGARIFAQDNGAGKTQLMVIFSTGAAQQIAIEP